jgi:hypothetical protein
MTAPVRTSPGTLGTQRILALATGEFQDYRPRDGHTISVFFVNSTGNGTANFYRIAKDNSKKPIAAGVAVTGGTELVQQFAYPLNQIRVEFTATPNSVVTVEAIDGGMA